MKVEQGIYIVAVTLIAMYFGPSTFAELVTAEDLCKRGDADMCRLAELERSIDAAGEFGSNGKYVWKPSADQLASIAPGNYRERAGQRAQLFCTVVASVWVSAEVAEYERRTSLEAVDRNRFDECMADELPRARAAELRSLGLESLKIFALVLLPVISFIVFWYRRPLWRQFQRVLKRIGGLGAN